MGTLQRSQLRFVRHRLVQPALQGYLADEKRPPPYDHHRSLGICYCRVVVGAL